jgi:hypothetical protein
LKKSIEEIGPCKVIGLTSDHATNMRNAWQLLSADYPWLVCSGCKCHVIHLACGDILKIAVIHQIFGFCKSLAIFFR